MKSYQERKTMFMDWSDKDLREALDVSCKKFHLKINGQRIIPIGDFKEANTEHLWCLQACVLQRFDGFYNIVAVHSNEGGLLPLRAYCQNTGCGLYYQCTYHEALRSLLAMFTSSTMIIVNKRSGEIGYDDKVLGVVPDFSSLEELKLKLAVVC